VLNVLLLCYWHIAGGRILVRGTVAGSGEIEARQERLRASPWDVRVSPPSEVYRIFLFYILI